MCGSNRSPGEGILSAFVSVTLSLSFFSASVLHGAGVALGLDVVTEVAGPDLLASAVGVVGPVVDVPDAELSLRTNVGPQFADAGELSAVAVAGVEGLSVVAVVVDAVELVCAMAIGITVSTPIKATNNKPDVFAQIVTFFTIAQPPPS